MPTTWNPQSMETEAHMYAHQAHRHRADMQIERDFGHDITNRHNKKQGKRNKRRLADVEGGHYDNPDIHAKRRRIHAGPSRGTNSRPIAARATEARRKPEVVEKPKRRKLNILAPCDKVDADNELACVEYLEEMFQNLRAKESGISSYMKKQTDINSRMRTILLDWLVEVHHKFKLSQPTFHLAVHLLDRFLCVRDVKRTDLQLVGSTCLWVSSKYHEIYAPEISDFIYVSDRAFNMQQMIIMEVQLVSTLKFNLTYVIPLTFLERYIKIFTSNMREQHRKITSCLMKYFLEHSLLSYETALCKPSKLAAAVVAMSFWSIIKSFSWNEKFIEYTGYELKELLPIVMHLNSIHQKVNDPNSKHHRGLKKKFSSSKYEKVALLRLRPLPFKSECTGGL